MSLTTAGRSLAFSTAAATTGKPGAVLVEDGLINEEVVIRNVKWTLPKASGNESKPFKTAEFHIGPFVSCSLTYYVGSNLADTQAGTVLLNLGKLGDYAKKEEILHIVVKVLPGVGAVQQYLMQSLGQQNWSTKEKVLLVGDFLELVVYSKHLIAPSNVSSSILKSYAVAFDDQLSTDVTFKVAEDRIGAHVFVVSAMSPVMRAMFQHDMKENNTKVVEIKDIRPRTFRQMLSFMYSGKITDTLEYQDVEDLFVAADRYGIQLLRDGCQKLLCTNVNERNIFKLLRLGEQYSSEDIRKIAFEFLVKNAQSICMKSGWREFMKNQPTLAHEAVVAMVTGKMSYLGDSSDDNCKQQ